ncbi:MAG TPA: hypothetical protein VFQ91_19415 [Bryobacteraceae bacterium]|nr:hypothetical protein [Bryobacteraceae bacterium]
MTDPAAVRAHVEKIQASAGFANAERLRRFLHFTVEAHLRGEAGELKEYVLGREVFDRGDGYDPRTDPIVRVEARRLRQRLAEYYAGPGSGDALRIEFPKGTYAPSISHSATPAPTRMARRKWWWAAGALAVLGSLLATFYYPVQPKESMAIVPARWTFVDTAGLSELDEAVAERIAMEVTARKKIHVIGWPFLLPYRTHPKQSPELAREVKASRVMAIAVRPAGAQYRVTAILVDPSSRRKMWAEDFYARDLNAPKSLAELALTVAHDLEMALGIP